jgi:hypothetical protein
MDEASASTHDILPQRIIETEATSQQRAEVNETSFTAVETRLKVSPIPTPIEEALGTFAEELDPQVRDAVLAIYELGYTTFGSGFWGEDNHQTILGEFRLNDEIKQQLLGIGVNVRDYEEFGIPCTDLNFSSYPLSLAQMKLRWDQAAAILPPTGKSALPSRVKEKLRL